MDLIFCHFLKRRLNRVNLVATSEAGRWHMLFEWVREHLAFKTTLVFLLFWDFIQMFFALHCMLRARYRKDLIT